MQQEVVQLCIIQMILLVLLSPVLALSSNNNSSMIAKPGCMDRCGNLSIPFPFGVGPNCALPGFEIICNTSTNPPIPHYDDPMIEIIEINTGYVRIKYPFIVAGSCYNMSANRNIVEKEGWYRIELSKTQYTLSKDNWLTAIGCDDIVVGLGEANQSFGGGCISYCADKDGMPLTTSGLCPNNSNSNSNSNSNGNSVANGCCRVTVPRGTTSLGAQLCDLSGKWRSRKLYPCSYAFVEEKSNESTFSYPLSYLNDPSNFNENHWPDITATPVVRLDWRIGKQTCSQARNNSASTYACQDNTHCLDFGGNVGGYLCRCLNGYQGNPYLTGGCQDINECTDSGMHTCDARSYCTNKVGSFICSCPNGFYGDGTKSGTGCTPLPRNTKSVWIIGLGCGLGSLLLLATCFWLHKVFQKRKEKQCKEKFFKRNGGLLLQQQTHEGTVLENTKLFPAKDLDKATDHYNESRILGQGGQGTVYKGMLSDGKIVAIKKSKLVEEDQIHQFINEVVLLSQINHRNVVKLLGCCLETEVPLLVYEFVSNGTLFDLIHDPSTEFPVPWNMRLKIAADVAGALAYLRLKIAADVAGALAYLHSSSSIPIYHRDIKSSNILLDEKFIVKVADFGTSKSFAVDQTHLTTMVKGTFGYLDPEYFQSGQFTEKSDVYSFGVVVVELLTGQRPVSSGRTNEEKSLVARFLASMEANNIELILDPQVMEQRRKEEVVAVTRLAHRCLRMKGKMRPTMKEVATELESLRISQTPSTVKDEYEEATRVHHEAKSMVISDNEYTWTTYGNSVTSSSSDTHPLMF